MSKDVLGRDSLAGSRALWAGGRELSNQNKPLSLWEIEIAGLPTMRIEARSASEAKSTAAREALANHQMTRTEVDRKLAACRRLPPALTPVAS